MNRFDDALAQLQELKSRVLESQLFLGYSGAARLCGAAIVVVAGLILRDVRSNGDVVQIHLFVWGVAALLSIAINYGSLLRWYAREERNGHLRSLRPALDPIAPLLVAALITLALIRAGLYHLLFGSWMMLYGLMHTSSRVFLPRQVWHLGWYYILCGAGVLFVLKDVSFTKPAPMVAVFAVGECIGAAIFINLRKHAAVDPD